MKRTGLILLLGAAVLAGWTTVTTHAQDEAPAGQKLETKMQKVSYSGGESKTMATFSEPGDYVLRVLASDASAITEDGRLFVAGAGYAQCCWTNGFVNVKVTE